MALILNNKLTVSKTYGGMVMAASSSYAILDSEIVAFRNDANLINALTKTTPDATLELDNQPGIEYSGKSGVDLLIGNDPRTKDNRRVMSMMRMPAGYTIYPVGVADDMVNGTYGNGSQMRLNGTDANTKTVSFQMLGHFYAIGGRVIWEGADLNDYMSAILCAPKTTGILQAGDFDKYEVAPSSGLYIYVPAAPGAGAWDLDISEKLPNTDVLKCTPVPSSGNTGYFDYNSDTNILTVNTSGTGGYNLHDWDVDLFAFARCIHGRKQDGAESVLEVPDVEGKLLYNSWIIKFELNTSKGVSCKAGIIMALAAKKNI